MKADNIDDFMVGNIQVSPQHNTIAKDETTCRLQPKAMAVLHYLALHHDRVINNEELLDQVWQDRIVTHSSIQKCVNALRTAFAELDASTEYIVYFSKRGYQLISPEDNTANNTSLQKRHIARPYTLWIFITIFIALVSYFSYLSFPFHIGIKTMPEYFALSQFTQVKPYVSNTGREQLIEPHSTSDRVAFVRDELSTETSNTQKSHLLIKGNNGQEWLASTARGDFVYIAWSPSGRNLVAIDLHPQEATLSTSNRVENTTDYSTLHIYTLDFKAEKIIEKNRLSHWSGRINSVSWWDEGTLEFTASLTGQNQRARYRYSIADQNLSTLSAPNTPASLLSSHTYKEKTAIHSILKGQEYIEFLDENQAVQGKWPLNFSAISLNWLSNGRGVLLLSSVNQLHVLYTDGRLDPVQYSPSMTGRIKHLRSKNQGGNIVFTVTTPLLGERGGGFIYSTSQSKKANK